MSPSIKSWETRAAASFTKVSIAVVSGRIGASERFITDARGWGIAWLAANGCGCGIANTAR
ncbi:hypothetical protein [Hydrogenophaga sp.]|uniref:hypothetical protein n=1 Tax=Hydrogenophaga sp. TaxID=1904254 RepID=UPI00272AF4E0|nr:hypothetical protein [Hydrogenophaga sp.]